jgi:SAM-dependent methyltransferase
VLPAEYESMHSLELSHWWFRGRRRVLVDLLQETAAARASPLRILDYGCGTGGNTSAYVPFGTVIGIEPDAAAVRLARQRAGTQVSRASGTELPFRPETFDAVVASDVLEHIEKDRSAVSEIARVLTPGGVAIVSVPAHQWLFSEHDAALHHFRRYSKAGLRTVLEQCGLRVRRLSYWDATLFPAICLYRLLDRMRRNGRRLRQPRSDTTHTPWLLNEALVALLAAEASLLRHLPLPWGSSLLAVAQRA